MSTSNRQVQFRSAVETFLAERRNTKLEKLAPDDPKYQALVAQFKPEAWLEDAAKRAGQIQAVTHTLKAIHPDARGTNLFKAPDTLPDRPLVGSHVLITGFATDVVGNAAALDVYKFLKVEVDGRTLLDWMLDGDQDLRAALSEDPAKADEWIHAFTGLVRTRGDVASHSRAKQLYWLVGNDPHQDGSYHLLAPLYASSLAHRVHADINEARFGDQPKEARTARREGKDHPHGYAEYRGLAVQKLGGTKPQNISQLNSERGGNNYLLASLPPSWETVEVRRPWFVDSVFPLLARRPIARQLLNELRRFLRTDPSPTMPTRDRRDELTDQLVDELLCYASELRELLQPGWSADPNCRLVNGERLWLDPWRAVDDAPFRADWLAGNWADEIGQRFGRWLNGQLKSEQLPMGDIEQRHWRDELIDDQTWSAVLDKIRHTLESDAKAQAGGAA